MLSLNSCRSVIDHTRSLDATRLMTFVSAADYDTDVAVSASKLAQKNAGYSLFDRLRPFGYCS